VGVVEHSFLAVVVVVIAELHGMLVQLVKRKKLITDYLKIGADELTPNVNWYFCFVNGYFV